MSSIDNRSKILIIEDNDVISRLWQITLEAEGFRVEVASSGDEGIEKATQWKPSVILLDLIMPDMDGFQVFENLRKVKQNAVPIIILTNVAASEEIERARKLGADDFIIKSTVLPEQLIAKIRSILSREPLP